MIYHNTHPKVEILGKTAREHVFKSVSLHKEAKEFDHILLVRFGASLFYANASYFVDQLRQLSYLTNSAIKHIVIDAERASNIDITAMILIEKLHKDLERRGITLAFARINDDIKSEFAKMIEKKAFKSLFLFDTITSAVAACEKKLRAGGSYSPAPGRE